MAETVQDAVATPTVEEALDAALQIAPACRTLRQVAGEVNESLGLDWTAAKWRGIWKHEAHDYGPRASGWPARIPASLWAADSGAGIAVPVQSGAGIHG